MNKKQKTNWWIDLVLFFLFIAAFFLDFTGVEYHQWLGMLAGGLALYHLLTHMGWVNAVSRRLFSGGSDRSRLYYIIDAALFSGLILMVLTGLVISTWFDLDPGNYEAWYSLHVLISTGAVLVLAIKLGLHWRWIAGVARKIWMKPAVALNRVPADPPLKAGASRMGRGEFLQVMGVVGAASFLALISASKSLATVDETDAALQTAQEIPTDSGYDQPASQPSTSGGFIDSGDCSAQCGRHCSYPGHCRRYVDQNSNNYCDLGDCV